MIADTTAAATRTDNARRFARMVVALAGRFALLMQGIEWTFMAPGGAGEWDIAAWCPRDGHLTLQLCPVLEDGDTGAALRTVTVCPGAYRTYDVVSDGVIVGEAWRLHAAMSIALDHVTLPMRARQQQDHDTFAV